MLNISTYRYTLSYNHIEHNQSPVYSTIINGTAPAYIEINGAKIPNSVIDLTNTTFYNSFYDATKHSLVPIHSTGNFLCAEDRTNPPFFAYSELNTDGTISYFNYSRIENASTGTYSPVTVLHDSQTNAKLLTCTRLGILVRICTLDLHGNIIDDYIGLSSLGAPDPMLYSPLSIFYGNRIGVLPLENSNGDKLTGLFSLDTGEFVNATFRHLGGAISVDKRYVVLYTTDVNYSYRFSIIDTLNPTNIHTTQWFTSSSGGLTYLQITTDGTIIYFVGTQAFKYSEVLGSPIQLNFNSVIPLYLAPTDFQPQLVELAPNVYTTLITFSSLNNSYFGRIGQLLVDLNENTIFFTSEHHIKFVDNAYPSDHVALFYNEYSNTLGGYATKSDETTYFKFNIL